jgi:hypothetical protein
MKPPKGVTLVSAKYIKDYTFLFTFSNGRESLVDFTPVITHGTSLLKFLDPTKFKKINIFNSDIYWGRNWDMCFHLHDYYGETEVGPIGKHRGLTVVAAQYAIDYKVRIMFSDGTWKVVDFKPFLFAYDRGYYNKYRKPAIFKRFKIEDGNIVWGKNWDLIFPVEQLHKGKIKFSKKPLSREELDAYVKKSKIITHGKRA